MANRIAEPSHTPPKNPWSHAWRTPTNANVVDNVAAVMYNSANMHHIRRTDPILWRHRQVLPAAAAAAADGHDDKRAAAAQESAAAHTRHAHPVEHRIRTKRLGSDNLAEMGTACRSSHMQ